MLNKLEKELKQLSKEEYEHVINSSPTIDEIANAFYSGSQINLMFAKNKLLPLINAMINPNERELLFQGLYYRSYLRLASSVELKYYRFWESVASNCRTLFEILIDLKILNENKITKATEKYRAFAEAQKYEYAKKYVNEVGPSCLNTETRDFYDKAIIFVTKTKSEKNYKIVYKNLWGRENIPKTWTGKSIYGNAELAGLQEKYRYLYARICWDTHSGITNVSGFDENYFINSFTLLHRDTCAIFAEINKIIAIEFHLDKAISELNEITKYINLIPGVVVYQQNIDKLKNTKSCQIK